MAPEGDRGNPGRISIAIQTTNPGPDLLTLVRISPQRSTFGRILEGCVAASKVLETQNESWGVIMRRLNVILLTALLQCGSLAGCGSAPPRTTFTSRRLFEASAPIKRLLVLADVRSPSFGEEMYHGFEESMTNALASCGGELRVWQRDPMSLTEREDLQRTIKEFQPNAILRIDAIGGSMYSKQGVTKNRLGFELALSDVVVNEIIWAGIAEFRVTTGAAGNNDRISGESFGTAIITQLRNDLLLKGCPDGHLGPPYAPAARRHARSVERHPSSKNEGYSP
jgi:hypothetical protein